MTPGRDGARRHGAAAVILLPVLLSCSPEEPGEVGPAPPRVGTTTSIPIAEHAVELPGGTVWLREAGHGPVVLFLHGWRGNADQWQHQLQPVAAAGFRAVAPDLPGTRNSPLADSSLDRRDPMLHVPVLLQLLDRLKVQSVHVVGHSWGGLVAQRLALEHPDRVATLTLVDSSVRSDDIDDLEKIGCPTLIVWAENDSVSPLQLGQSLSQLIPGARLVVIPEVGTDVDPAADPVASHVPPLYKPEEFNRHLLEFLAARR